MKSSCSMKIWTSHFLVKLIAAKRFLKCRESFFLVLSILNKLNFFIFPSILLYFSQVLKLSVDKFSPSSEIFHWLHLLHSLALLQISSYGVTDLKRRSLMLFRGILAISKNGILIEIPSKQQAYFHGVLQTSLICTLPRCRNSSIRYFLSFSIGTALRIIVSMWQLLDYNFHFLSIWLLPNLASFVDTQTLRICQNSFLWQFYCVQDFTAETLHFICT